MRRPVVLMVVIGFLALESGSLGGCSDVVAGCPEGQVEAPDGRCIDIECTNAGECPDDGNDCTAVTCNEATRQCETSNEADGITCDFMGGAGLCMSGICEEAQCELSPCEDGNECTVAVCPDGADECSVQDAASGTPCDGGAGECSGAGTCLALFPCTEQGIRDAIAEGGGPHRFDCDGPQTIVTSSTIALGNGAILDGEGNLTVEGVSEGLEKHRVFSVPEDATAELIGMTVTGGDPSLAGNRGAGILNEGTLRIVDCTVTGNGTDETMGGGIYNSGTLELLSSIVSENRASTGGGIDNNDGMLTLSNSIVSSNAARSSGSGIHNGLFATLTMTDCTVSENFEISTGDTSAISTSGATTLINTTVSDNISTQSAGIGTSGTTTLVNSTVSGNGASYSAGTSGIEQSNGTLRLISTTIVASGDAWAILHRANLIAKNSVLVAAGSTLGTCQNDGTTVSEGGNVEALSDVCGFTDSTDLVEQSIGNLALGPLQDNGGPTQTHALLSGSVALDRIPQAKCTDRAGDPLATDQRGEPRPATATTQCDAGAFERQPDDP